MNITLTTKADNITEETKEYIRDKAEKLDRFYKIRKIEIVMDMEGEKYSIDLVVSPERGGTIVADAVAAEWFTAMDNVCDRVERQLRRIKEKTKSHRVKKFRPESESQDNQDEETYDDIVNY